MMQLGEAAENDDAAAVAAASHSLNSSSASLGALRLAELLATIERSARAGNVGAVAGQIAAAQSEFVAAEEELLQRSADAGA